MKDKSISKAKRSNREDPDTSRSNKRSNSKNKHSKPIIESESTDSYRLRVPEKPVKPESQSKKNKNSRGGLSQQNTQLNSDFTESSANSASE